MKKGLVLFHRGWTDQIAMMPVINYYRTIYDNLTILNVPYAKCLFDFYLKDKKNVETIYSDIFNDNNVQNKYFNNFPTEQYDYLFHGKHDKHRVDKYRNVYMSVPWRVLYNPHLGKRYYEFYDIDFINKVQHFDFVRDYEAENKKYEEFIKNNTVNYILYHDDSNADHVSLFRQHKRKENYVNLHGKGNECFYYIKILEHAKEIHLIDSFWAQFCYLLDARFSLFKNKQIYVYPFTTKERWGGLFKDVSYKEEFKLEPVELPNWKIVS